MIYYIIEINKENSYRAGESIAISFNENDINILLSKSDYIKNLFDLYITESNDSNKIVLIEEDHLNASKFLLQIVSNKPIYDWNSYWAELSVKWSLPSYSEMFADISSNIIWKILTKSTKVEVVISLVNPLPSGCVDISGRYREYYDTLSNNFYGPGYIRSDNKYKITLKHRRLRKTHSYYWVIETIDDEEIATFVTGIFQSSIDECFNSEGWLHHLKCPEFKIGPNYINPSIDHNDILAFAEVLPWILKHQLIAKCPIRSEDDLLQLVRNRQDLRIKEIFDVLSYDQKLQIFQNSAIILF